MKNAVLFLLGMFFVQMAFSQAPKKFHYQAVARDPGGTVITGNLSVKISFLEGSDNGTLQYTETHNITTNGQGVFNLNIGEGIIQSGEMDNLQFHQHEYWLKVEMKTPEAVGYTEMGKTQLLSVPYAMYAEKAGNELQPGNGIQIDNGTIHNTGDLSDDNEIQELYLNGDQLSISGANTVTLPTGTTYTAGNGIEIYGNVLSATDASSTNELQNLNLNGHTLSISNGNAVNLPAYQQGSGIQINGNLISAVDPSLTNELQSLSLNGSQLSLSNGGGSVQLPGATAWSINNSTEITSNPSSNSVVIGSTSDFGSKLYVASTGSEIAGNFFSPSTGAALNAYCNGSGPAINASSLNGTGAVISSINGTAASFDGGNAPAVVINQNVNQNAIEFKYSGNTWGFEQHPLGTLYFNYNGSHLVWISHGDGSYHTYSDRNLKTDIKPFSNVLPKLTKLQAYTYHMKNASDDSPLSLGLIAQEVEEQFPQLVTEMDGYKSICYDHFAVLAVQAIKEQQVQISQQTSEIKTQQSEINELRKEVDDMKAMLQGLREK